MNMILLGQILKVIHIIAVVCWFAGLFYLPRLFVYHTQTTLEEQKKLFCIFIQKSFIINSKY